LRAASCKLDLLQSFSFRLGGKCGRPFSREASRGHRGRGGKTNVFALVLACGQVGIRGNLISIIRDLFPTKVELSAKSQFLSPLAVLARLAFEGWSRVQDFSPNGPIFIQGGWFCQHRECIFGSSLSGVTRRRETCRCECSSAHLFVGCYKHGGPTDLLGGDSSDVWIDCWDRCD
jgi:hypothetical protein